MSLGANAEALPPDHQSPRERAEQALLAARRLAHHHWLISLEDEPVLRAADASTARLRAGRPRSALDGMLVAIKDQFDVAGEITTCGTRFLRRRALRDAEAVARLRAAGAIPFGKANLYELALGPTGRNPYHGDAHNPWDTRRDTGGSSSGCAALVAAGIVPLALGSDLGGSLRIPASLCGVAAIKPTFGRVPTEGLVPVAWSLEHVGPMARSIEELFLALAVLAGDAAPLPRCPSGVRIGICEAWWSHAEPETARVTEAALRRMAARGALIRSLHLPPLDRAVTLGSLVATVESAAALAWALRYKHSLGAAVRVPLAIGRAVPAVVLAHAQHARAALNRALESAFQHVDVIATPTTDRSAPRYRGEAAHGEIDEELVAKRIAFTVPFNLAGLPAVQVPCGFDSRGLPVGLQLAGPRGADLRVLAVATAVEAQSEKRTPRLTALAAAGPG
jgi:Asp-tRNA(Asn)/Glu-tRNA(Gln) amidotransferase A subunit family amidase